MDLHVLHSMSAFFIFSSSLVFFLFFLMNFYLLKTFFLLKNSGIFYFVNRKFHRLLELDYYSIKKHFVTDNDYILKFYAILRESCNLWSMFKIDNILI